MSHNTNDGEFIRDQIRHAMIEAQQSVELGFFDVTALKQRRMGANDFS